MKRLFSVFFFLMSLVAFGQSDLALKKIGIDLNPKKKLTVEQLDDLNVLINDTVYLDAKTGARYSHFALREAQKIEYAEGQVNSLHQLSKAMIYSNELDSALIYAKQALRIADKAKDGKLQVQSHNVLAGILSYQGHQDQAADEYFLMIQLAEKYTPEKVCVGYANLGHIFKVIGNIKKSREYSEKSLQIAKKQKDTTIILISLNLLGLNDYHEHKFHEAITHYREAERYAKEVDNIQRLSQILYNMGNAYFELKEYELAFKLFYESIEINQGNESYSSTAIGFHGLAEAYQDVKQPKKALAFADSALYYAELGDNLEIIMESYSLKARIENDLGHYKTAYNFLNAAYAYKDSMNLTQLNNAALDAEDEFNKKQDRIKDSLLQVQHELEVSNERKVNDQKIKTRDTLIWVIGFVLVLVTIGIYFLYKNMKEVQKQKDLVSHQKEEIQTQHNEIKDSINYAKRIQDAIISKSSKFSEISEDNFVLFLPKNVVSGDFYWSHTFENGNSIWAVGDCTGHGVPGAFMSLLGIGFLNEIVIEQKNTDPGRILDMLRDKIQQSIEQEGEQSSSDGMDIGLCFLDRATSTLHFSGANNGLWILRKEDKSIEINEAKKLDHLGSSLYEIAPDKMPIGRYFKTPPPFSTKQIQLIESDIIVLFTDGYADQFGGPQGKKLKYSTLKSILLNNIDLPMSSLLSELTKEFEDWKNGEEQVDDVCLVGIRLQENKKP